MTKTQIENRIKETDRNMEMIFFNVDWNLFKGNTKGKTLENAKTGYIGLCELLYRNDHKLMSEYKNNNTKILVDFNCGHEPHWIVPHSYKKGRGCPKCSNNCPEQAREEFLIMLESNNHKLLSEYINNKTKILIDFNCGHDAHWITPSHYKSGKRCPKCGSKCLEQAKAKEDLIDLINKNGHVLLSDCINNKTKVLIDFSCGHEPNWITPNSYKNCHGCPKCAVELRTKIREDKAKEDFLNMLKKNNHELLSEYINVTTKVLVDFNCGHEPHWITPDRYKKGQGCPLCAIERISMKTKEDFLNTLERNNHKLLSEYINNKTKILIDFNCGHDAHWITPNKYKQGKGCPLCKNKGESALYQLLLDMEHEVETQKKYEDLKDKSFLPYDFYLPEYNLLIELDGEHHFRPVPYTKKNMTQCERDTAELDAEKRFHNRQRKDKMKDDYAKKNNIPLLRIDYYDGKIELDKWKQLILNKIKEIELMSL